MAAKQQRCLVTGATGYIGGRLVPRLLESGFAVRALARTPDKLSSVPWRDRIEVARGEDAQAIDDAVQALAQGTEAFAAARMNRGIRVALAGRRVDDV